MGAVGAAEGSGFEVGGAWAGAVSAGGAAAA
eukprot:CAMPEP_0185756804 /NCGR_PEP_ID=MMETSP1174-20130828/15205_1 /TAXON_ID=35687 /ORGANISM="Dictyocha speculum, Strain CCMP1381" /LENGTH=30 /DNA_ID= /DNA_START= /DNA_END= /DNA_ORIENTATION=